MYDPRTLEAFLEKVGHNEINGCPHEWHQMRPACLWAVQEIRELREKLKLALWVEGQQ